MANLREYLLNIKGIGIRYSIADLEKECEVEKVDRRSECQDAARQLGVTMADFSEGQSPDNLTNCFAQKDENGNQIIYYNTQAAQETSTTQSHVCKGPGSNVCPIYHEYCQRFDPKKIDPFIYPDLLCGTDALGGSTCIENCCAEMENHCRVSQIFKEMKNYGKCMEERGCLNHLTCDKKVKGKHLIYGEIEMDYNYGIDTNMFNGLAESPACGSARMGGAKCRTICCKDQHDFCHIWKLTKHEYIDCMRKRGCHDDNLACREDGLNPGKWMDSSKILKYAVPLGAPSDKQCGSFFQGGSQCEPECCERQHTFCMDMNTEVRGYFLCMEERGCWSQANFKIHGKVNENDGLDEEGKDKFKTVEGNECNYNNKAFGIECIMDESCVTNQVCGSGYQGGSQCEKDCCKGQHQYCWNGNLAMWGYFKCMKVRGCGNVMSCNEDGSKAEYYNPSPKTIEYIVAHNVPEEACGSEFQGGSRCEEQCCERIHKYSKFWETEVRGYVNGMRGRGCNEQAKFILHGKNADGTEANECNYMNKNFGIECLLDESCVTDQLCGSENQGGAQCEKDCCKKQHQYCWNGNLAMWGYFKCMRVRGCQNVQSCSENGYKEGYYDKSPKTIEYIVAHNVPEEACGSDFQGGSKCEPECCERIHKYSKFWETEVRGYVNGMRGRGCNEQAKFILHGKNADGTEANECNYMGKAFGIECLFDESCVTEQLCGSENQGGPQCQKDCCKNQHKYCWNGNLEMWGYFKCMRVRGCFDVASCNEDGSKANYYDASPKIIPYAVPVGDDVTKACGSEFQGGEECRSQCCVRQDTFCDFWNMEVRGFLKCMKDKGCHEPATVKFSGPKPHDTHKCDITSTQHGSYKFGIECFGDESCVTDQLCGTELQGNFACGVECCKGQHEYCHRGAFDKRQYFKCMKVRGCGGRYLACSGNGHKNYQEKVGEQTYDVYYPSSDKNVNYDVPCLGTSCDFKCGSEANGGSVCKEECCKKQAEFCNCGTNAKGCLEHRGCDIADGGSTSWGFSLQNKTTKEYHVWPSRCITIGQSCNEGSECADHDLVTGVGTQCCEGKCEQKKKDWIGAYYCPHEVVCFDDCCDNSECGDGEVCAGGICTSPKNNGDPHYTTEVGCHSGADDPSAGKCKSLKSCGGYCRECYEDGHCTGNSGTDGCRNFVCTERSSREVEVWCPCGKDGTCCCNCCWPWEGECACGTDSENCDFTEYYYESLW